MREAPSFDPQQYKAAQRQTWDCVAAGWRKWWGTFERGGQAVSDRLVALAEVEPGHQVLDVATGIGEPAVTAARRVGPEGRVVATDLSLEMLAIARERAAELGLANLDFQVMDAEALELPAHSFDAVLSRWALMFFPDRMAALARIHELLRPGGRLALAVWDKPGRVPIINLRMEAAVRILEPPAAAPGTPHPFSLAEPRLIWLALRAAGFAEVHIEGMTATFDFDSPEEFTRFQRDVAGARVPTLAEQPPERQAAFWQALTETARQYAGPDGRVRMPNSVLCATARRP
jgi:SAM-dependent methyltransferase